MEKCSSKFNLLASKVNGLRDKVMRFVGFHENRRWSTAAWHLTRPRLGGSQCPAPCPVPVVPGKVGGSCLSPACQYLICAVGKGTGLLGVCRVLSFQQGNHQPAETCTLQVVWLKQETLDKTVVANPRPGRGSCSKESWEVWEQKNLET